LAWRTTASRSAGVEHAVVGREDDVAALEALGTGIGGAVHPGDDHGAHVFAHAKLTGNGRGQRHGANAQRLLDQATSLGLLLLLLLVAIAVVAEAAVVLLVLVEALVGQVFVARALAHHGVDRHRLAIAHQVDRDGLARRRVGDEERKRLVGVTSLPSTRVTTSPAWMPALAAPAPGSTDWMNSPRFLAGPARRRDRR
jgi:hypothetical protein